MSFLDKILNPIVKRVSDNVTKEVTNNLIEKSGEIQKSEAGNPRALVIDPMKMFYRTTEKGLRKPTRISFKTLRRMSRSVHVVRLCINTLKHKVSQTEWSIVPTNSKVKPDEEHIKKLQEFFENPNQNQNFRTFADGLLEDILALDAGTFEKVNMKLTGEPAEAYHIDGATIKPMYDINGILGDPAYCQFMPLSDKAVAEWSKEELVYIMQNPQTDIDYFGYGLSPLESVIMVATNLLNADNYMGQFFDVGTLPPKIINLGKEVPQAEVEAFRAYWKSEIEGKPWKTGIYGGGEMDVIDMSPSPVDVLFEHYQIWLMKLICAAYELSPQDLGFTEEMSVIKATAESQERISASKGYRSLLTLLKETFNQKIVRDWFGYTDVKFDWIGLDTLDPLKAAQIWAIESRTGAVSINDYRQKKGLAPIVGGVKPFVLVSGGIQEIDATLLDEVSQSDVDEEKEAEEETKKSVSFTLEDAKKVGDKLGVDWDEITPEDFLAGMNEELEHADITGGDPIKTGKIALVHLKEDNKYYSKSIIEKKVHTGDYVCWMDDRGYGQPFIWTDSLGKAGYVIKPPVAVNINGLELEPKITQEMSDAGLNVLPVNIVAKADINNYLPSTELRREFKNYQQMTPQYDSKKWEVKYGHSRIFDKYIVMPYIDGRSLTDTLLMEDMKRDPDSYDQAILDLAKLWQYEKENGLGDRRPNQYIITPEKRAYGIDYQFEGNPKAWEKYKMSIANALNTIPKLKTLFTHETGLEVEEMNKSKKKVNKGGEGSGDAREGAGRPAGGGGGSSGKITTGYHVTYDPGLKELSLNHKQETFFYTSRKDAEEHLSLHPLGQDKTVGRIIEAKFPSDKVITRMSTMSGHPVEHGIYNPLMEKYNKERSQEEYEKFWVAKMVKPEKELIRHIQTQVKQLKPNMARIIQDELTTKKARISDNVLAEAVNAVPESDMGLKYTKSVEKLYKDSFELGIDNFLGKVSKRLKRKVSKKQLWDIVGKKSEDGSISKAIERSGLYDKLKERGTNMIKTVMGNKQQKLINYIQDQADQGVSLDDISDSALEKFSLPLDDYEVERIAKTETAWAANQGAIEAGNELGIEDYEILKDPDACEECSGAYPDGEVFKMGDFDEPPLHPNCRCSVEPFIDTSDIGALADKIFEQLED